MNFIAKKVVGPYWDIFWITNPIWPTGWENWARVRKNRDGSISLHKHNAPLPFNFNRKVQELIK